MIYSSPRILNDECNIRSKVYAVEFERKNTRDVLRCLKETFAGMTMFLMARLCFTHPKSFANALKMQNKTMTETYAIPLINTTPDEIFYLQPLLETTAGVIAVLPTRRTTKTGRYNILVKSKDFKQV